MVLPPLLPERGRFKALFAWLNQLREYAQSLRPAQSFGTLTSHTAIGVTRQSLATEGGAEPGVVQRFYLDAVENTWLNCRKAREDGTPIGTAGQEGDFYRIAKPPGLRLPSDGSTIIAHPEDAGFYIQYLGSNTRQIFQEAQPTLLITEKLRPAYTDMDTEIYATRPVGKTGLFITIPGPNPEQPERIQLEWIECTAVRHWSPSYQMIKSCAVTDLPADNWQRLVLASARTNIA